MKTYIALLRGINVGGHKKVPMAMLREVLTASGLKCVTTYIQSGNVIFKSCNKDAKALEHNIQKTIFNGFGFVVPVMVRTRAQLNTIFGACPFSEKQKVNSYFAMLSEIPNKDLVKAAYAKTYENEDYKIINDCLYLYGAKGYGNAKFSLNSFERKLKVVATSRNYKTMVKLLTMSQ